jgi:hypothetical protein
MKYFQRTCERRTIIMGKDYFAFMPWWCGVQAMPRPDNLGRLRGSQHAADSSASQLKVFPMPMLFTSLPARL